MMLNAGVGLGIVSSLSEIEICLFNRTEDTSSFLGFGERGITRMIPAVSLLVFCHGRP
jgi:hypothetical protein